MFVLNWLPYYYPLPTYLLSNEKKFRKKPPNLDSTDIPFYFFVTGLIDTLLIIASQSPNAAFSNACSVARILNLIPSYFFTYRLISLDPQILYSVQNFLYVLGGLLLFIFDVLELNSFI